MRGDLARRRSAELVERGDRTCVHVARDSAHQHELGRPLGMAGRIAERNERADRRAEQHGPLDLEGVEKRAEIIRPRLEVPARRIRAVAAPVAALIEVDHLRDLCKRRADRVLEERMVGAWPRMQEHDCLTRDVTLARRNQRDAFHVEEEHDVADADSHASTQRLISSTDSGASRKTEWRAPSKTTTSATEMLVCSFGCSKNSNAASPTTAPPSSSKRDGARRHEACVRVRQDELRRVSGPALRVPQDDETAPPSAKDDRPVEAEHVAELSQILRPRLEVPVLGFGAIAVARATQVHVDHLRAVCEGRPMCSLNAVWSVPGPVCTITTVGRVSSHGPAGRSPAPSTSKKSRTPLTSIRMPRV